MTRIITTLGNKSSGITTLGHSALLYGGVARAYQAGDKKGGEAGLQGSLKGQEQGWHGTMIESASLAEIGYTVPSLKKTIVTLTRLSFAPTPPLDYNHS